MNRKIRTIAFIAVMGLAAVGCQQEQVLEAPANASVETAHRTVTYIINGAISHAEFSTNDDWLGFVDALVALVEEGNRVEIRNPNSYERSVSSKEKVTYSTAKRDDAITWCLHMLDDGYTVTMEYDKKTGVYTCTAVK